MISRSFGWCCAAISLVSICSCARDRLVQENFRQIRAQVTTEAEVVRLIGEPDSKLQEYWVYQRPDKHLSVFVEFDAKGRVVRTQWVDALGETWEDSDDRPKKD